jgi:hypothetical protein
MTMGHPKHPIFSGSTFGLMSGEKPLFQSQVQGGHEALGGALQQMGLHAEPTSGKYKEPERSYIIHGATQDQMKQLGKMFGQESVIHSENGQHKLIYTNGEHEGKYHASDMQNPLEHFEQPPDDFYTSVPGHGHFRINFDWSKIHHLDPVNKAEREFEPELVAYLMKNAVADLLADQAPVRHHPHNYEWHDGHSSHHEQDHAAPQLPGLTKADAPGAHPHMDAPPKPVNDQAAGVGVSTYKQFALPYGNVQPGSKQDLLHYNYHGKLPEIQNLVQDHGYKTYYAGGKYGKPDLANKNYNTGHLMVVYDPSPSSGGDFGHENYTNGWRQIHELAHALTLPEVNKIYGEGRRMGKLGTHRNMNEALRAVHWEWLAAHKQRELSKQVGVPIKDEDFHKELNTVMHDAAHRAVTGKFTEPSGEGFTPHSHKVPLHNALQMVRDAGNQMGLKGLHDLIPKQGLAKSFPGLASPKAAGVTQAPAMHNTVEGFMGALKAMPKGDPARGKHITSHMNHGPFLQALQAHPQGKQIHSMLTAHLNSTANAGFKPGSAQVTMKSEAPTVIFSKTEGDTPVADEKLYTPEEAREVLIKATREKVDAYAKEIEALRTRELKKSLIPNHKHNQASQASSGVEDVPPGKINGKGVDKSMAKEELCKQCGKSSHGLEKCGEMTPGKAEKAEDMDKAVDKIVVHGDKKPAPAPPGADYTVKQGKGQTVIEAKKSELVDAKGNKKDNHTVAGSKTPPDAGKHVNKPGKSSKTAGSGGVILPGSKLKKSATPPMAKPPSGANMGTSVPTSAPKAPAMAKGMLADAAKQADPISAAHAAVKTPAAPAPKMPTPAQHADRAAGFQAAMGGAFQPKPAAPAAAAPKLPGAGAALGLKSPKAAGVTRSAGPVMNAARPAPAAKPGIFGKLFGKGEDEGDKTRVCAHCSKTVDAKKGHACPEQTKWLADNKASTAAGKKGVPVKPSDKK